MSEGYELGDAKTIDDVDARTRTSWDERRVAGKEVQESSSTTYPPNARFSYIKNGDLLTNDERDVEVAHTPPTHTIEVEPGDTWVVRGTERNQYMPGIDSVAGIAWSIDEVPESQYLPDNVEIDDGYATFDVGDIQGQTTAWRPTEIEGRIYHDGSVVSTVPISEWTHNPFEMDRFQFDLSEFAVKRRVFDLYGAGDFTNYLKLRNTDEEAEFIELYTIGVKEDPNLVEYDQPNSVRVENNGSETITVQFGPIHFFNIADAEARTREHFATYRDLTVTETLGSDDYDVLKVYRLQKRQISVMLNTLNAESADGDFSLHVREVHPDFITWPDGFDADEPLDAYDDWRAPDKIHAGDTAVQEADIDAGEASIATFADSDGYVKPRGRQLSDVETLASGSGPGGDTTATSTDVAAAMNELMFVAVIAQGADIDLYRQGFEERW